MPRTKEVRKQAGVTSGERGEPVSKLFARIEQAHPGIEKKIGLSSAALRAGQIVRDMRKANGWTQTKLADLLGWDQERISNIERGEGTRGPTFDIMQKIATVCNYDLRFLPRSQDTADVAADAKSDTADLIAALEALTTEIEADSEAEAELGPPFARRDS